MQKRRFGLQAKLILIIVATVVVTVAISTYLAMWLTRDPVEAEIYRKALAQAELTAHELVRNGALEDPAQLLQTLRQTQHDLPGVVQSDVYAHRPVHRLVTTTLPSGQHLEIDNLPGIKKYNAYYRPDENQASIETPNGKYWIIGTTIRSGGQAIGCLNLKVSKSPLNSVTWDLVLRNLLLLLASLVAVTLVIHLYFLRGINRPVKQMVAVVQAAEAGSLHARAPVHSSDEIGELAVRLNRMLERIENFSGELSRKVEDATVELARRNEELERINEELFETQKKLARSERLAVAGQLAASLAHEIGTPLNSISGHVQLLARRKTGDEVTDRRLQIIESQIEIIVRTVRQLLAWTHKLELRVEAVNLPHLMEESVLISSPALQSRKIHVHTSWGKGFPEIYADAGYLQQVFLNLINNSMDAMPQGGELRLRLRHDGGGEAGQVTIEVEDTGEGIPAETLAHIFEPMFTTKRLGTGTGLGLGICQEIVRQHGGVIRVESKLHRGTRFTIVLPMDCRERAEAMVGARATDGGGGTRSNAG